MEQSLWPRIMELAQPYLNTRGNREHTEIALALAKNLLAAEGGQAEVVIPSVILHDVGWSCVPEELQLKAFGPGGDSRLNRIHEVEGVRLAGEILAACNYPRQWRSEILAIIDHHDSNPAASSLNDALVKDADKLWRFTPEGFRTDFTRFRMAPEENWRRLNTLVDEWMLTKTGHRLAKEYLVRLEQTYLGRRDNVD